jgi:hypothetical protein
LISRSGAVNLKSQSDHARYEPVAWRKISLRNEKDPGRPWGDELLALDFPGGPYVLSGLSRSQAADLQGRFGPYCLAIPDSQASIPVKVFEGPDSLQTQRIYTSGEYTLDLAHFDVGTEVQGLHFSGWIGFYPEIHGSISTPISQAGRSGSVFENYLRLMVAYRLLQENGLVLHSAAVVIEDSAFLFYGVSGAGKSTLSEMAVKAGCEVISDDLNAVLFSGNEIRVSKLPFTGTFSGAACKRESYPLQGIFALKQGQSNSTRDLSPGRSLASLLVCSPFVNNNGYMMDRLQEKLLVLSGIIPIRELGFSKDRGFDEIITLLLSSND